jgi:hypothetical protein
VLNEKTGQKKRLTSEMPVSRGEEKKDEEIFWFRLFIMQVYCQLPKLFEIKFLILIMYLIFSMLYV